MVDFVLDSAIRFWVFLPIILITFFSEILKHYFIILCTKQEKPDSKSLFISHALTRSKLLKENRKYLPEEAFNMRRRFYNNVDTGYFNLQKFDPKEVEKSKPFLSNSIKRNTIYIMSMMYLGTWINSAFSGFLTTKIPFPLTYRFKTMFQRGCEKLDVLDASWVSSLSWYIMNIFGLQSIYQLALGCGKSISKNELEMKSFDKNIGKVLKAEQKALELLDHTWALKNVCKILVMDKVEKEYFHGNDCDITADN